MPSVGSGSRVPPGGTAGSFLQKKSTVDFDYQWTGSTATSKVTKASFALGSQAGSQSAFSFITVANIVTRGIVSLFAVSADQAGNFDIEVRGAGSSGGTLYLQAVGITSGSYSNPTVWYYENDSGTQDLFVGIRNTGSSSRTFTLNTLRVERFA